MTDTPDDLSDALSVPIASAPSLQTGDCRRLTGPGLLWDHPGATLEVMFTDFEPDRVEGLWHRHARRVLDAVGWPGEDSMVRHFGGGISLAISAPLDQLYSATFVVQTAWHFAAAELLDAVAGDFASMIAALRRVMQREADPALVALADAASMRGLEALIDEDMVTLGHGTGSQSWPAGTLPVPDAVMWDGLYNLPIGLITGTNGKTTTTRLAAAMAREAGLVAGLTSTDMVRVGDAVLDRGDFSGPGGARLLLRDPRLEMGFLELARGGILRRGLPVRQALAAVVTNVAADHLGEYGVNTVPDLASAKFAVRHGLRPGGVLILNADDRPVVVEAARLGVNACWFSLTPDAPQIVAARAAARPCAWSDGGFLCYFDGLTEVTVSAITDIPIAMGGAALYNISNALAAVCLGRALGLDFAPMARALAAFRNDPADNPGRCNEFAHNGARVFVDFAHNPHSIAAVTGALAALPAKRRFIMVAHAGDRSDQDIRDLARGAVAFGPDFVVIAELPDYLRGREPGEVSRLLRDECLARGFAPEQLLAATSPADGAAQILARVAPGDMALLLVHSERDKIFNMLSD